MKTTGANFELFTALFDGARMRCFRRVFYCLLILSPSPLSCQGPPLAFLYDLVYTLLMNDLTTDKVNPLESLKTDAAESLRRILYTSKDEKVVTKVATDILNSLKDNREDSARPIVIKDSQIQILMQVAKEAF